MCLAVLAADWVTLMVRMNTVAIFAYGVDIVVFQVLVLEHSIDHSCHSRRMFFAICQRMSIVVEPATTVGYCDAIDILRWRRDRVHDISFFL
jgi:hypothetical protein